jgi:hypothetical protein
VNRAPGWSLADVIDFVTLVSQDENEARDRQIFEERIAPLQLTERSAVFHVWLEARRSQEGADLPGEHFLTGWHTLLTIAVGAGLIIGGLVASPALLYHGEEPVNVVDFLAGALGLQWLLLIGALLAWLLRRTSLLPIRWRPVQAVVSALLLLISAGLRRLPGEQRLRLQAAFGRLERRREIYGSLAVWPVLICTQLFAVCFNVGVLTTLLWRVTSHEQRFGWQTTLDVASERAGQMVATFAAPWAWAPNAHPTVEQVVATRYAPHQSHATLPPGAMRAWWPFLFYAVGCYGLIVRALLLAFAAMKLRGALSALRFDHADASALWRRLTGPLIHSSPRLPENGTSRDVMLATPPRDGKCIALISHELSLTNGDLDGQLLRGFRLIIAKELTVKIDQRQACAEQLAAVRAAAPINVAVIIPAERDPIMAIMLFLGEVVAAAGAQGGVLVLLSAPVDEGRVKLWRDFVARERLRVDVEGWKS